MSKQVAVLFAHRKSEYKTFTECDVYDKDRDATTYTGNLPVIAHPPCRAWGQLRGLANPEPGEKELAYFALDIVRKNGGVLEHPMNSLLFRDMKIAEKYDGFGGFLLPIYQHDFGHRADKKTLLYIVGISRKDIPLMPLALGEAPRVCGAQGRRKDGSRLKKGDRGWRPEITKNERELTPEALCEWLVELACRIGHLKAERAA